MPGARSFQLARIFGIRIGADTSWFIALFLLIWIESENYKNFFPGNDTRAFTLAVASVFLLVGSILLHELGHAIVAIRNDVGVSRIDLWIFGGFAQQKRESPTPWADFKITVAGPLVTLGIAVAAFALGTVNVSADTFIHAAAPWEPVPRGFAQAHPTAFLLSQLCLLNAILFVFNLLPGMPLDGGRVVRAAAWKLTGDRNRGTRIAARCGRVLSWIVGGVGLAMLAGGNLVNGFWLFFIALFIGQSARAVESQTVMQSRIEHLRVADVMDSEPVAVPSEIKLDRALDEYFMRYGWDWFPSVDVNGHFIGLVSREDVEQVPDELRRGSNVSEVVKPETRASYEVGVDEPLEALLGSEGLARLGAIMAVDGEGVLRGVVTIEQVSRALKPFARTA